MVSRWGGAALVLALALGTAPGSRAAGPATGVPRTAPVARPAQPPASPAPGRSDAPADPPPQVSQDAAARARMHECAHQWSTIKKAGNAGLTTWKEFSATCLVVSR